MNADHKGDGMVVWAQVSFQDSEKLLRYQKIFLFFFFFFKGFASNVFKKLIPLFRQAGEPQWWHIFRDETMKHHWKLFKREADEQLLQLQDEIIY